jgi:hypothetical protein
MASVICRALLDLGKARTVIRTSPQVRDEAWSFILGEDCEAWCLELGIDYKAVKERAASLYRRFLEKSGGREKAPREPRKRPGHFSCHLQDKTS